MGSAGSRRLTLSGMSSPGRFVFPPFGQSSSGGLSPTKRIQESGGSLGNPSLSECNLPLCGLVTVLSHRVCASCVCVLPVEVSLLGYRVDFFTLTLSYIHLNSRTPPNAPSDSRTPTHLFHHPHRTHPLFSPAHALSSLAVDLRGV